MVRAWTVAVFTGFLLIGLASAVPAQAADILWNFGGGCSVNCGLDGQNGNTRSFTANNGTTTVTVAAWSTTGNGGLFENAFLGRFTGGLGVTNRGEGNGDSNRHTLDNVNHLDVMAFFFSEVIDVTSIGLTPFKSEDNGNPNRPRDSDISAWIGTVAGIPDLTGDLLADLNADYGSPTNNTSSATDFRTATFNPGLTGNFLLLAGQVSEFLAGGTGPEDAMKVKKLGAKTRPPLEVPEPGSMATFAIGLIGLGFMARRRRSRA